MATKNRPQPPHLKEQKAQRADRIVATGAARGCTPKLMLRPEGLAVIKTSLPTAHHLSLIPYRYLKMATKNRPQPPHLKE